MAEISVLELCKMGQWIMYITVFQMVEMWSALFYITVMELSKSGAECRPQQVDAIQPLFIY